MLGLGLAGKSNKGFLLKTLYEIFDIVKNSDNPNIRVHLLGVAHLPILEQVPCYSSDSSTWLRWSGLGRVLFYDCSNTCKIINFPSRTTNVSDIYTELNRSQRNFINKRLDEFGYTIDDLYNNITKRTEFNLLNLKELYKNYKPRYNEIKCNLLF